MHNHKKIIIGIFLGILFGLVLNFLASQSNQFSKELETIHYVFASLGKFFIQLLKMLVVPLVFSSVFVAIINLSKNTGDFKKLGTKTMIYYLSTTGLAVAMGILVVSWINPGKVDGKTSEILKNSMEIPNKVIESDLSSKKPFELIFDTFLDTVPENIFASFTNNSSILQVLFLAIFLALICSKIKKKSKAFVSFVSSVDKIMHKSIEVIMFFAPYFLFFLISSTFMKIGFNILKPLLLYGFTVLFGLFLHAFVTLPIVIFIYTKSNPFNLYKKIHPPLLIAWSTASSAAALPITIKTMEKSVGVEKKIARFVLPLGSTVNMDGTALYESVAVIFIAGILGYNLDFSAQAIVFFTATLAAVGAAAIPSAGLVTMGIVLMAVGLPLEAIGIVIAIDYILDQFRTTVNVLGDCTAAYSIDYNSKNKE